MAAEANLFTNSNSDILGHLVGSVNRSRGQLDAGISDNPEMIIFEARRRIPDKNSSMAGASADSSLQAVVSNADAINGQDVSH